MLNVSRARWRNGEEGKASVGIIERRFTLPDHFHSSIQGLRGGKSCVRTCAYDHFPPATSRQFRDYNVTARLTSPHHCCDRPTINSTVGTHSMMIALVSVQCSSRARPHDSVNGTMIVSRMSELPLQSGDS